MRAAAVSSAPAAAVPARVAVERTTPVTASATHGGARDAASESERKGEGDEE
jgi:hypothetical protein